MAAEPPAPGAAPAAERAHIRGVVFDLDGVLTDTEHLWEQSWRDLARRYGADWGPEDSAAVMGMSSPEWSRYVADHVRERTGAEVGPDEVQAACVVSVVEAIGSGQGPLMPGARRLVEQTAARVPIALASSAARPVIDTVLAHEGLTDVFTATVSSEEVARGKPAPDVYTEAARRLGPQVAGHGLAVEDSSNGIRAADAAGLVVVAIPNQQFPPAQDALALAALVADDHEQARAYVLSLLDGDGDGEGTR